MASSYALPASAMTHSHGHGHVHSHSTSQARQYSANSPRPLKTERSNGSLHAHSQSESYLVHGHDHSHNHNHSHSHSQVRSSSPYLPTPPNSNGLPPIAVFEKHAYEPLPTLSQVGTFEPPLATDNAMRHDNGHIHTHGAFVEQPQSKFTSFLMPYVLRWPLLHTVFAEKDSRRIFYFMSLNFAFMLVQACYGYLTNSLGLLSDSIHMFFDCLALGVGLFASIASKWPPSQRFPYGFGKIESLSGFGNGVFLMLISIEILIEATERLAEGRETHRLAELFVVSALGLAVNLVGMACFGHHGHAGHDHGDHSHGHSHSHSHSHETAHSHSHDDGHDHHSHDHGHDHDHDHDHDHKHSHDCSHQSSLLSDPPAVKASPHVGHSHSHDNENMHGIFLHVLADTMGSAAVMVSTALIYFVGWNGWDPLASCVIAILIFLSSVPLIKSSAKKLLLTVPDAIEYNLREALAGVSDIRGVASYSVPRFWVGDQTVNSDSEAVSGVMHVVATRGSDLDDVRQRTREFLLKHGMDVVVQVESDGDTSCWCGGSAGSRSPSRFSSL